MSAAQLQRLHAAMDCISEMCRAGAGAAEIVDRLLKDHAASRRLSPSSNTLRIAGVATSCTWSQDQGLIDGWRRLAMRRILRLEGRSE